MERRIEMTGWSTVVLGLACLVLSAVQAAMPILLRRMAEVLDAVDDPTRAMREAWVAGAGIGALANALFGVALVVIGLGVTRRSRWSHPALSITCWGSILILAVLARPTLAPFFALAGEGAPPAKGMLIAAATLVFAQAVAVLWFLRFWRKPEVRDAFR